MPTTENLPVEYHQQDTDYYCGAACAQMVLHEIGAGHISQDDLYNDNHTHSIADVGVNWASGPDGVTWTMNHHKPASFSNYFVLFQLPNEDSISRKIVWTIHHYNVAPIALVYGLAHWIVIKGFDASAAPSGSSDTSFAITGFYINNPWPPSPGPEQTPTVPPPPHTIGDICGSGGIYGIANEHISYNTWKTDYMTGVPGGHWSGKFLAVCDPEPAPKEPGRQMEIKKYFDGENIIDKQIAQRQSFRVIEDLELSKDERFKALLNSKPTEPVLVKRLDRANDFYYLVGMEGGNNNNALLSIDARFGTYKQTAFFNEKEKRFLNRMLKKEDILKLLGRRVKIKKRVINIHPEAICIYPALVWKPCKESLSPYWPFYMVTIGDTKIYVRIDGAIFTSLTTNLRGI